MKVISGGKKKIETTDSLSREKMEPELKVEPDVGQKPKRQKLITDFHTKIEEKIQLDKKQVQENLENPMENLGPPDAGGNQEVRDQDLLLDENMARRGKRAMIRSQRKIKEALDKFNKYTNQYRYLSGIGDKRMSKARREANRARENWMDPERLDRIMEEEEPLMTRNTVIERRLGLEVRSRQPLNLRPRNPSREE